MNAGQLCKTGQRKRADARNNSLHTPSKRESAASCSHAVIRGPLNDTLGSAGFLELLLYLPICRGGSCGLGSLSLVSSTEPDLER